jgi:hypothetical protein
LVSSNSTSLALIAWMLNMLLWNPIQMVIIKVRITCQIASCVGIMSLQNLLIEEGQTKQWQKEKGQNDKQRSTKHYTEN